MAVSIFQMGRIGVLFQATQRRPSDEPYFYFGVHRSDSVQRLDNFMRDDVQIERKIYVRSTLCLHPAEIGWLGIGQCK